MRGANKALLAGAALAVFGAYGYAWFLTARSLRVPRGPLLANRGAPPQADPRLEIARRYAPYIRHATSEPGGRQDVPSNVDFDGDLTGNNNWENFERFELKPTAYYAVLETRTHYFVAWHLFHPRDWSRYPLGLNDTHENDGENLQVVARKSDGTPVLLWTQAHYRAQVHRQFEIIGGTHPVVYVEAEGHGIYGSAPGRSGTSLLFRPAEPGETVREPDRFDRGTYPYQLDSTTYKLWPLLRDGRLAGDGKLLDGSCRYQDALVTVPQVPRYYDADRWSGPLGSDRGISPFALDFSFRCGTLGALFFNPAQRYQEQLHITGPWSTEYLDYPFR